MRFGGKKGYVFAFDFWGVLGDEVFFLFFFALRACLVGECLPPAQAIISIFVTCVSQKEAEIQ